MNEVNNQPDDAARQTIEQQSQNNNTREESQLTVDIRQYQTLLDVLNDGKKTLKVGLALMVLVLAIFMAVAFTTIAIKRFYPYNEISTNMFGATTMQNEEVELTYWLFNTAELWANSGIRVEEGNLLTIRASGQSNTSVHHLVDNAYLNSEQRYKWVGTEGEARPANTRTAFRLYPRRETDALLMQIIPEDPSSADDPSLTGFFRPDFADYTTVPSEYDVSQDEKERQKRYYHIGKERVDLRVTQSGMLHFAVNDIVLTNTCIDSMEKKNNAIIDHHIPQDIKDRYYAKACQGVVGEIVSLRKECDKLQRMYLYVKNTPELTADDPLYATVSVDLLDNGFGKVGDLQEYFHSRADSNYMENLRMRYNDNINKICSKINDQAIKEYCDEWRTYNNMSLYFGAHPRPINCDIDYPAPLALQYPKESRVVYPFYNEMTYYREQNYYQAWYDDNIGSFLIVVEKRKK